METLVSSWFKDQSLPENYVFPPETRPGEAIVPVSKNIPIIDLGKSVVGHDHRNNTVQQILNAAQKFGFFQVNNHGVSERQNDYSKDPRKGCSLYTSSYNYDNEEIHFWRDNLRHPSHPLDEVIHRDVVGTYSVEVRSLSLRILDLICEGLGLQPGYFGDEFTNVQLLLVNHYPPCPNPSLTLGLSKHSDPNLITILLQGEVNGLQVFKDGQWIGVEPLPSAFVDNIGYQFQVISNGKLRSAEHRAVTNSRNARTTIVTFINPSFSRIIEPAKALVNECKPPLYRAFRYGEFLNTYKAVKGDTEAALKPYKLD
ncbi:unnamed protein product [Ilex paraguariensis]|uniref:Fe2OG dioxygenase domain-containing protein n=1 Tax=Ilex paraguariensis TaxID=185542 RepID=A0ABC8RCC0_9AQUA